MKAGRLWGLTLAFSILAAAWAQPRSADEAAAIYDPGRMYVVDLHLPQASGTRWKRIATNTNPGRSRLAETDGTPKRNRRLLGAAERQDQAQGERLLPPAQRQVRLQNQVRRGALPRPQVR